MITMCGMAFLHGCSNRRLDSEDVWKAILAAVFWPITVPFMVARNVGKRYKEHLCEQEGHG